MKRLPVLETRDVSAAYGKTTVLRNITISVEKGEIVVVIGLNGAGKTTLLRTIVGLHKEFTGNLYFMGEEITKLPISERIKRALNMVPEGGHPFPYLTVRENLVVGGYSLPKDKVKDGVEYVFQLFPVLRERRNQFAGTLSGGERRMLAIGRALMTRPRLLMIDELSLGLAPKIAEKMLKVLSDLVNDGETILLVEQNARRALQIADRGYALQNGEIVLEGTGDRLLRDDYLRSYFSL